MRRSTLVNWLLLLAVVVLVVFPVAFVNGEFAGSDGQATDAIAESHPGYTPWFSPIYEPPSEEVASGLFALQAAIGAGLVGYYFGVVRTRRRLTPAGQRPPTEAVSGTEPSVAD